MTASTALGYESHRYPDGPPLVLVAEDNRSDQRLLREAFNSSSCEGYLDFVSTGVELLNYLTADEAEIGARPNLILLDLNMPLMDGQSALQAIKRNPSLRTIPVVVFTASRDKQDVSRAYDAGANVYMAKPDSFVAWVTVVETILQFYFKNAVHPDGA